jgi:NADH-quinone oxidoreductase subunit C
VTTGAEAGAAGAVVVDHPAVRRLRAHGWTAIIGMVTFRGETTVLVERTSIVDVCAFLRHDPDLRYNFLSAIQCCDWLGHEPRFEVSYHLLSMERHDRLRVKIGVPEADLVVPTGSSARSMICLASRSPAIPTCGAS